MSKKDALSAMLEQYENSSNSFSKNNSAKEYDLKNYFTTHLSDKEKNSTKRIRILPTNDESTPFKQVYGHKVQVEGEWKTFTCLKHEMQEDCPFCEAYDALRATGKEAQKELAKKYSPRKMYVVKVIDRDNEDHGVKFWRFNHDYRKQGVLDKIYGVLQAVRKDITDPETGRDLLVLLARDQNGRPAVQTITHMDPTPLSDDKELANQWLADERTWKDVYSVKPYEYLEIIVKGGVPAWDKNEKKFVDKVSLKENENNDSKEEITFGTPNVKSNIKTSTKAALPVVAQDDNDEEDSDLPF
jgi:hypothetical protein